MAVESGVGQTWPEQEAAETWWRAHSLELKKAVTVQRVEAERKLNEIREICLMEGPPPGADSKMILVERVLGIPHSKPDAQHETHPQGAGRMSEPYKVVKMTWRKGQMKIFYSDGDVFSWSPGKVTKLIPKLSRR